MFSFLKSNSPVVPLDSPGYFRIWGTVQGPNGQVRPQAVYLPPTDSRGKYSLSSKEMAADIRRRTGIARRHAMRGDLSPVD